MHSLPICRHCSTYIYLPFLSLLFLQLVNYVDTNSYFPRLPWSCCVSGHYFCFVWKFKVHLLGISGLALLLPSIYDSDLHWEEWGFHVWPWPAEPLCLRIYIWGLCSNPLFIWQKWFYRSSFPEAGNGVRAMLLPSVEQHIRNWPPIYQCMRSIRSSWIHKDFLDSRLLSSA